MSETSKDGIVALLACGGTIDKIYFDADSAYRIGEPAATGIIARARAGTATPQSLMRKDSLDMTDADRAAVVAAIRACEHRRVVVTHGTDTMAETARAVAVAGADKTVVFVGAFLPAAFRDSDADFNVGFALGAARSLPPGVYVAMNGRVLSATAARKNRAAGRFEAAPDTGDLPC